MKTYFIIGGSSGIGQALTIQLCHEHTVYATYHRHEPVYVDSKVSFHPLNVLAEDVDISYLPAQLDGLVYCPGSIVLKPFHRFSANDFEQDYRLQLSGAVKVIQAALPRLKKSPSASIVLFSTIAATKGFPFHSIVSASKGAVEGFTKALAAELAPGIRVNCIARSITDTPLAQRLLDTEEKRTNNAQRHPLKKIGAADDIASAAVFLLSDQSSWITGQVIHVDGGLSSITAG
jgi:NAD(P)-dependent dehydrogenase (short-subunit alcohol dehydrogenase family)